MRLRTAIKIQRLVQEPWRWGRKAPRWKLPTRWESLRIGRRKWRDRRFPYIPDEDEAKETALLGFSILADAIIEDEDDREAFKEMLWANE